MDCFLPANKLRCLVAALSFGCVFLWVASGLYLDRTFDDWSPEANNLQQVAVTRRKRTGRETFTTPLQVEGPPVLPHRRLLFERGRSDNETAAGGGVSELLQWPGLDGGGNESGDRNASHVPASALYSDVHKLKSTRERCTYIKIVGSCQNDGGLLSYLQFIYCTIPYRLIPLAMVVLFFWLIFMFIFLGATAEEYFCPALSVISDVLHLGQNVAGVTLLALGNGAPDIFSAFAAISQTDDHKSSLAIGALFGAGIFDTTVVVGGVAFLSRFTLTRRPFLRDIIFYTIAVYWTFYLLWTNTVTIFMAAGFIALYVFYVVVVIVGRIIYQKWKKRKTRTRAVVSNSAPEQQPKANGVNHTPLLLPSSLLPDPITSGDGLKPAAVRTVVDNETEELEESRRETDGESDVEIAHRKLGATLRYPGNESEEHSTVSEAQVYPGGSLQVTTDAGVSDVTPLHPPSHPPPHPAPSHQRHSHPCRNKPPPAKKEMNKSLRGANGPLFPQV